ncbi:MAG: ankyrin repeat domain-containing protein [Nitrospinae bacterium]|nr:ankyrin repeat domain-containing protein [Nitrospinota bacterium]
MNESVNLHIEKFRDNSMLRGIYFIVSILALTALSSIADAKSPDIGDVYRTSHGKFAIKIISTKELEVTSKGESSKAAYTANGDSLQITINRNGKPFIESYQITPIGLKGPKGGIAGDFLYSTKVVDSLFIAVKEKKYELMKSLLSQGIDPNYEDEYGQVALIFSIIAADDEGVKILLAAGANPNSKDTHGSPVLLLTADEGYIEIVKAFLSAGAEANKKDSDGTTPLMEAAGKNHLEIVNTLLTAGADPDMENNDGTNALWAASLNGLEEIAEVLIPITKNLNSRHNLSKTTSLTNMAQWGKTEIVKLLLEKGANPDAQDEQGWTALLWAAKENYPDIARLLLDKGANLNAKNRFGETALKLAKKNNHKEMIELLKKAGAKE